MKTKLALKFLLFLVLLQFRSAAETHTINLRAPVSRGSLYTTEIRMSSSNGGTGGDMIRKLEFGVGASDVGGVNVGDKLEFLLFDDVTIVLTLKERMPSPLAGEVFLAEADGYEGVKTAVVLRTDDGLTIDVQDFAGNRLYKVIATATDVTVWEIVPSGKGNCGCDALLPPISDDPHPMMSPAAGSGAGMLFAASGSQDVCVDILVVYDKNAAVYANATGGGITNFAQLAVQKMNMALSNTGLDESFRFRLVGVETVDASASDVEESLHAIHDGQAGWETIKNMREAFGADIVTTMIDTGTAYGSTGIAWSLASASSLSSFEQAYNVCAVRAVSQSNVMTHECGHNLGAGHATEQKTQPGPQLYQYSAGYFFGSGENSYCTIMSYGHENPNGNDAVQIPYFSSPLYSYNSYAVGDSSRA